MKIKILGYEIRIEKAYFNELHVSPHCASDSYVEPVLFMHDFNMAKRINVMVKHHGFIEYIFRDLGIAVVTYNEFAVQLLEDILHTLLKIRTTLKEKGATEEQLAVYDAKIYTCFHTMIGVLEDLEAYDILEQIKEYDIKNYHVK